MNSRSAYIGMKPWPKTITVTKQAPTGGGMTMAEYLQSQQKQDRTSDYLSQLQKQQEEAKAANLARYQEAKGIYQQALGRYGPEGTFGAGYEAQLGRQKTQFMAGGEQSLAQRGLYGTTIAAGLGKKFEEEVGAPARLKLEDIRQERLTEAERAMAGLVERREDVGVDMNLIAQLMMRAGGG